MGAPPLSGRDLAASGCGCTGARPPAAEPASRLANKECQRNRVQSGHGEKTNACQCEHLRHGSPFLAVLRQRHGYSTVLFGGG